MDPTKILVIEIGGADRMLFEALEFLRRDPAIVFALAEPQSLAEGERVLQQQLDIQVVLLVTSERDISQELSVVHEVRPDVHILAVSIDACPPHFVVRNPNYAELTGIIKSLGEASRPDLNGTGKILKFRARLPSNDEGSSRNLPAPIRKAADPASVTVIEYALRWVESATRSLLHIWSGKKDETAGFALSWGSLERWLSELIRIVDEPASRPERDFDRLLEELRSKEGRRTPLASIAEILGPDNLSLKLLLISIAPDLDIRFHRLFGALHDDFGRRYPSLGLACAIVATATPGATPLKIRAEIAALDRLRELGLIEGLGPALASADEPLRTRTELVDWLLTAEPDSLAGAASPQPIEAMSLIPQRRLTKLNSVVRLAVAGRGSEPVTAVLISGSAPGWLQVEAAALDPQTLLLKLPETEGAATAMQPAIRSSCIAAVLAGRRLVVDLGREGRAGTEFWATIRQVLPLGSKLPYVVSANPALQLTELATDGLVIATLPSPSLQDRREVVEAAMRSRGEASSELAERIADTLPVALENVPDAVALALSSAADNGRIGHPDEQDWSSGFRRAAGARVPRLARRIEPKPCESTDDSSCLDVVVLPEAQRRQLEEIIRHARHARFVLEEWGFSDLIDGQGVAALFSGESGTGKSTSAHAVASELKADLYSIELSQVVSKYIGETEKNLDIVFDEAERAGAVLLFDEADALFGKRTSVSDAHDRYANIEVAYLLQRMQLFSGLAILTTNNSENLDPAFARRIAYRVAFPRPSALDRLAIWERSLPAALRASSYSLSEIAFSFDVTGGTIRQMALHAAVLAAEKDSKIEFAHVLAGVRSQLVRLGLFSDLAKLDAIEQQPEARAA